MRQVGNRNYQADHERETVLAPQGYERGEETFQVRDWKGVNIQANRTGLEEDDFFWLENILPIGHANLHAMPHQGNPIATLPVAGLSYWQYANIGNVDYLFCFMANGAAYQVQLSNGATVVVGNAGTFTLPAAVAQWKNERICIIAANGYWDWNGTTLVNDSVPFNITASIAAGSGGSNNVLTVTSTPGLIGPGLIVSGAGITTGTSITSNLTGTGGNGTYLVAPAQAGLVGSETMTLTPSAPTSGSQIASFAGRIWIVSSGRTVNYSAPNSYFDFTQADAGGFFVVTDETLRSTIQRLLTANNYLYIIGASSFNVLSDVRVVAGTPATTIFSNANVTANIGSTFPLSVFPWYRLVMFATPYGFYALSGATPQKVSTNLDGLLPFIDFSQPVTGGVFNVYGILGAAFMFTYRDPGRLPGSTIGSRPLIALYFDKKWAFASQGNALTLIAGAFINGVPQLYGTDGQSIWNLFSNTLNAITTTIQSALWPMKQSWINKQVIRAGLEVNNPVSQTINFAVSVDNEYGSVAQNLSAINTGQWVNAAAVVGNWANAVGAQGGWVVPGYSVFQGDAYNIGRYVGLTLQSTSPSYTLQGLLLGYTRGAQWAARPGT